jgi:hypothetical protein
MEVGLAGSPGAAAGGGWQFWFGSNLLLHPRYGTDAEEGLAGTAEWHRGQLLNIS